VNRAKNGDHAHSKTMMIGHIFHEKLEFGFLSYSFCFVYGCFIVLLEMGFL